MAGAIYSLSATNITDTTATIIIEALTTTTGGTEILTVSSNGTTVYSTSVADPGMSAGDTISTSVTGLTASTTYDADVGGLASTSFTTKATGYNSPKNATQEQWEDLANIINGKAVITVTSVDPGEGSALAENHYVAVYGGDPIITDYFTSEKNTGVKWIDGSAIYKKTINFGALPNADTKTVAHDIPNLSRVIKIEQSITNGGAGALVLSSGNSSDEFNFYVTSTNIGIHTTGDRTNCDAYITIYYTKSS